MKPQLNFIAILSLVIVMMFTTSVYAFEDIKGDPAEQSIMKLKEAGIVSGEDAKHFNPKGKISFAQGVYLITKSLDLNINHIKFVKEPLASDYFTSISDQAWYAQSFIIAHLNGLPLDKDVNPNHTMTREQFGHLLMHAIKEKADFSLINPNQEVTRAQAAMWLHSAREFVKIHEQQSMLIDSPVNNQDVTMKIDKETNDVNKVTITWNERPNSGYGITITGIEFKNNEAVISYELHYPEMGMNYLTVISYPKATTYISSQYTPVLKLHNK